MKKVGNPKRIWKTGVEMVYGRRVHFPDEPDDQPRHWIIQIHPDVKETAFSSDLYDVV